MRDSAVTRVPLALKSRKQRFTARLATACEGSKQKETYNHPMSSALISKVIKKAHKRGREAETLRWAQQDEAPPVMTVILSDDTAAKRGVIHWVRGREAKGGPGVWMWWTDRSRSDDCRVEAVAVCKHTEVWRAFRSHLSTGRTEVCDAALWAICLSLRLSVKRWDTLQTHGVTKVGVFSESQAAIRQTEHLEPGPVQHLARWIN
jgi:hypothetical protein